MTIRFNLAHQPRYSMPLPTIWRLLTDPSAPQSLSGVARDLGVTHVALRKRLLRHGYYDAHGAEEGRDDRGRFAKVMQMRLIEYERHRVYCIAMTPEGVEETRYVVKSFMFEEMAQTFALTKNIECLNDDIFVVVKERVRANVPTGA